MTRYGLRVSGYAFEIQIPGFYLWERLSAAMVLSEGLASKYFGIIGT